MYYQGRSVQLLIAATLLTFLNTACSTGRMQMTDTTLTKDSVVQFLNQFEETAEKENFDLVQDMVHDKAVFRFNDGDFVGKQAVRDAFEKTWKGGSTNVKKMRFYLTDIAVLTVDAKSATATYTYNWEGAMDGRPFRIQGRGTRVMVIEDGRLQIIHEHLSRFPGKS
jgi:ketosteroid isomerase-like protein